MLRLSFPPRLVDNHPKITPRLQHGYAKAALWLGLGYGTVRKGYGEFTAWLPPGWHPLDDSALAWNPPFSLSKNGANKRSEI